MTIMEFDGFSDEAFAAYVAGFTDGEGHIGVEKASNRPRGPHYVRVTLANTVSPVLRGIQKRLGYGAIRSQQQKPHWREKFVLVIGNMADCERFLVMVRPYLQIKADVADQALVVINDARNKALAIRQRNGEIRQQAASGKTRRKIAEEFGVSPQLISRICEGHKWPSEISKFAKVRKRDTCGLFIPINHSSPPLQSVRLSTD